MILTQEQRADLREFFDHDKKNVFEVFMKAVQDKVRRKPVVGSTEWETISATLTREAQIDCITELLRLLAEEMAYQEVENAQ